MLNTTLDATRALLKADPSLTPADRAKIVAAIREHGRTVNPTPTTPPDKRIMRRAAVAEKLAVSTRTVDNLARSGTLTKVKFPGRVRASGFRSEEVDALITG